MQSTSCFLGRFFKNVSKGCLVCVICALAMLVLPLASFGGVRTVSAALNASGRFTITLGEASGTTNMVFAAYGATSGGDTPSEWDKVDLVGVVPMEETTIDFAAPSDWESSAHAIRFFAIDGDGDGVPVEYVSGEDANVSFPLNYTPTSDTRIQIKFMYVHAGGSTFIGTPYGTDDNADYRFFRDGSNTTAYFDVGNARVTKSETITSASTIYNFELGNHYIKNLDTGNDIVRAETSVDLSGYATAIQLFAGGDYGRVYSLKIYEGESLARDLEPRLDLATGKGVFRDSLTGTIYEATGTGATGFGVFLTENYESSPVIEDVLNDSPAYTDYAKRIHVVPSGATVAAGQSFANVPVLLRLSTSIDGFSYSDLRADGKDMLILDEEGNTLPYEIEVWNPSGESLVWVKVPHYTSYTRLTAYYGDAQGRRNAANDPRQTWSAYSGVWHFDEQQAAGSCRDSSPNAYHTQNQSANTADANGVFGGARNMAAGSILVPNTTGMDLGDKFTLEGWVTRTTVEKGSWDHLFYKKNASGDWGGWCTELYGEGNWGSMSVLGRDGRKSSDNVAHGIAAVDTWYHIVIVYDETSATLYNNGVAKGTSRFQYAPTWTGDNIRNLAFGSASNGSGAGWKGSFDEFRISTGAMSAERVATDHKLTQADAMAMTVRANTATRPVIGPSSIVANGDGTFAVSTSLSAGTATSVKAVLSDGSELELAPSGAMAGWSVSGMTFTGVPSEHSFTAKIRVVDGGDYEVWQTLDGTFYSGEVSVARVRDAREDDLSSGAFAFSRAAGDAATAFDLVVNYTVTGTAVAGKDYEALSGTVTIPAGESSATVTVTPKSSPWTDEDVSVTVAVSEGPYVPAEGSATVMIFNCRDAAIASFTKRTVLSFPGYAYETPVSSMPVLVRLRNQQGVFNHADITREDHGDLAFYAVDGTKLPHEIDTWDPDGTTLVWVRVPNLRADTTVYMLYGGGVAAANDPTQVWNGYVGVWHMNETASGAGVAIADSSAHQLHGTTPTDGTKIDTNGNKSVDGAVGGGRKIATAGGPAEKGRILVPNNEAKDLYTDRRVTASMWFRIPDGIAENWAFLIDRKAREDWDIWGLQFNGSSAVTSFRFCYEGGGKNEVKFGTAFSKDVWHHVVAIWTEGYNSLYIDGREIVRGQGANWLQANQKDRALAIGGLVNDNGDQATWCVFPGDVDEVRVQKDPYSKEQAISEYEMVTNANYTALSDTVELNSSAPAVGSATIETVGGKQMIGVPLEGGSGRVYVVLRDSLGNVTTNAVTDGIVSAGTYYYPVSSLPVNLWCDVGTFAEGEGGKTDSRTYSARARNAKEQRITLRVNGYTGENAVANFPALVRLSNGVGGFNYARLSDEGATAGDIHFQDASGNELPFEVDTWNPEGESLFWVKMPSLSRGAKIFLVYGVEYEPAGGVDALRAAVWTGQTGVWHMYFNSSGGDRYGNSAADNIDTMRGSNNNDVMQSSGIVGEARSISQGAKGATGGTAVVISNNDLLDLGNNFTVSVWLKYKNGQDPGWDRVISRKNSYDSADGWEITLASGSPSNIDVRGSNSKSGGEGFFSSPVNDGNWHYVTAVYSGKKVSLYENGVFRLEVEIESAADNNQDLSFGNNAAKKEVMFKGVLDEIRLGAVSLSADRIKADYETVADPEFFAASESMPSFMIIVR